MEFPIRGGAFVPLIPPFWVVFFFLMISIFVNMNDNQSALTERETQILRLIAAGQTTPRIAEALSLSPETIKWYRKRLLSKLGADNTAELVRISIENKII